MSRLDAAFFLSDVPVAQDVTLADGSVHVFHFRQLPAARWAKYHEELTSDDADVSGSAVYRLIADCVCMPDGDAALTVEESAKLKPGVVAGLRKACYSSNELTAKAKNDLPPGAPLKNSGSHLPSHSEAELSTSGAA